MSSPVPSSSITHTLDASLAIGIPSSRSYAIDYSGAEGCKRTEFNAFKGSHPLHGFVLGLHTAFAQHLEWSISPDDIATIIGQGIAEHINMNPESHRAKLVDFAEGKKKNVEVRRDEFVPGSKENDWLGVVAEFAGKIATDVAKGTSELPKHMVPSFSTTAPINTFVYQTSLMSAMSNFCNYTLMTFCGIPRVTLRGTEADWHKLRQWLADLKLVEFDAALRPWQAALEYVIDRFVETRCTTKLSDGLLDWWKSAYKYQSGSGGDTVSGWICYLFPYLGSADSRKHDKPEQLRAHLSKVVADVHVETNAFPSGLNKVDFMWEYACLSVPMRFYGGFDVPCVEGQVVAAAYGYAIGHKD
jgi:hypothetical protein